MTDPAAEAALADREKRRAELAALATLAGLLQRVRTDAVAAWRHGLDVGGSVANHLVGLVDAATDAAREVSLSAVAGGVAAVTWILGRRRTVAQAIGAGVAAQVLDGLANPTPQEQATARAGFTRLAMPLVARLAKRAAGKVRDAVAVVKGCVAQVRAAVATALDAAGVGSRPQGWTRRNWPGAWAVEQVLEYLAGVGHRTGADEVLAVPAVAAKLTHFVYLTQRDTVVRPFHQSLDKMVRPVADPIWRGVTPPAWSWKGVPQYGCRCQRLPVFNDQLATTAVPAALV